ncbi:hypothetical protein [Streptomyces sp. NPDC048248]|uniref:hypothetical protein n=1 Tax=Streptomyces sp. NPDC048248 TaxID=3365523 RepID=UPI0037182BF7
MRERSGAINQDQQVMTGTSHILRRLAVTEPTAHSDASPGVTRVAIATSVTPTSGTAIPNAPMAAPIYTFRAFQPLALRVSDLAASIAFYSKPFGAEPAKPRDNSVNFATAKPPLHIFLIQHEPEQKTWLEPRQSPRSCAVGDAGGPMHLAALKHDALHTPVGTVGVVVPCSPVLAPMLQFLLL